MINAREKYTVGAINMIHGKVAFITFREDLNASLYRSVLEEDFLPKAKTLFISYKIMTLSTLQMLTKFIEKNVCNLLDWPSRSPDLNPLGSMWNIIKTSIRKRMAQELNELEDIIHEEWEKLPKIKTICESFPERVNECYRLYGAKNHY